MTVVSYLGGNSPPLMIGLDFSRVLGPFSYRFDSEHTSRLFGGFPCAFACAFPHILPMLPEAIASRAQQTASINAANLMAGQNSEENSMIVS